MRSVAIIEELLQGKDGQIWGAKMKIPKTNSILKRPLNKLYLVERLMKDTVNEVDNEGRNITDGRSKREAVIFEDDQAKM